MLQSWQDKRAFSDVETYCMFIGYSRSGHSLIGSLLDAHPDVVIAHEYDALATLQEGTNRDSLYRDLLKNSREFAEAGREWSGYSYRVPGQYQGSYRVLRVIGDKKGGRSTVLLGQDITLLEQTAELVGVPLRIVHVTRHPYDNIATMHRRAGEKNLNSIIDRYFSWCETNKAIRDLPSTNVFDLRHEDFVSEPTKHLAALCEFLSVVPERKYLSDCASIVFPSPRATREGIEWPDEALKEVRDRSLAFDFLAGYFS